jgi:hypothetical protein
MIAGLVLAGFLGTARAADPRYPDWPCAQAKVPDVSLAAVWAGPPLDQAADTWKNNAQITALVARLSARRTPLGEAEKQVAAFLSGNDATKSERGKQLFAGIFETLNAQRSSVMTGIERITRKQRAAADRIRADTVNLHSMQDTPTADPAKLEQLANQLTWQTRIFEDRSKIIQFVCEVPTAIDQRLFALGRIIQQSMDE